MTRRDVERCGASYGEAPVNVRVDINKEQPTHNDISHLSSKYDPPSIQLSASHCAFMLNRYLNDRT